MAKKKAASKKKTSKKASKKKKRRGTPPVGLIGGPGSTTIVIQPTGNSLSWLVEGNPPNAVGGGTPNLGPHAFKRIVTAKADVNVGGTIVYGVACMHVRVKLAVDGGKVFTLMCSGDFPQWFLGATRYAVYAPYTVNDWNADLMGPLAVGAVFEAEVSLQQANQPPTPTFVTASSVTLVLES